MILASFLSGFGVLARAALGAIRGAVSAGWDAARTVVGLQSAGVTIDEEPVDRVMARMEEQAEAGRLFNDQDSAQRFQPEELPFAITPIRRKYSFTLLATGTDILSETPGFRYIQVQTDSVVTKQQILDEGWGIIMGDPSLYQFLVGSLEIVEGKQASPTIGTL